MTFTEEQIIQSAPDIASLKAGKDLAVTDKWLNLFFNNRVIWGEAKGSGNENYRTQIDITGQPADFSSVYIKCTCPSRKFPCKHGLGLLFLYSENLMYFVENNNEPIWVKERMDKRIEKLLKPIEIPPIDAVDEKNATAKRLQKQIRDNQRWEAVKNGVEESRNILKDFMRLGLLTLPEKGKDFFQKTAARMIDAKASGLANRWKALSDINFTNSNWHEEAINQISDMYLLLESFRTMFRDDLPNVDRGILKLSPSDAVLLSEDIKTAIGFTTDKKELLENPSADKIKDEWLVLNTDLKREEDLMIRKVWLFGLSSHRFALILDFAYKTQTFENFFLPESILEAELIFFPSAVPQRAIINSVHAHKNLADEKNLSEQLIKTSDALALNTCRKSQKNFVEQISKLPWLNEVPQCVTGIYIFQNEKNDWLIKDGENNVVPVVKTFAHDKIIKLSADLLEDNTVFLFLLRNARSVLPLGIFKNEKYFSL